jgi:hypothetical protein
MKAQHILAFLLALLTVMSLASCFFVPFDKDNDTADESTSESVSVSDAGSDTTDDKPDTLTRGTIDNDVYRNAFVNITFAKPKDMIFATDAEIAQMLNITKEQLNDDKLFESASISSIIDFMVTDPKTNNNINATYEDLSKSYATNITIEQYADIFKNNINTLYPAYPYTFSELEEMTLGTETYHKLVASVTVNGISMQQGIYFRKVDKYMVSISVTVVDGTALSVYEACFS